MIDMLFTILIQFNFTKKGLINKYTLKIKNIKENRIWIPR